MVAVIYMPLNGVTFLQAQRLTIFRVSKERLTDYLKN